MANRRAIWNPVRSSARRVSAKRAPISANFGSGFLYTNRSVRLVSDIQHRINSAARRFVSGLPPMSVPVPRFSAGLGGRRQVTWEWK